MDRAVTVDTRVYMDTRSGLVPMPGVFLDENAEPVEDVRCDCCNSSLMIKVMVAGRTLGRTCYLRETGRRPARPSLWVARTTIRNGWTVDWLRLPLEIGGGGLAWISVRGETLHRGIRLASKRDAVAMAKALV